MRLQKHLTEAYSTPQIIWADIQARCKPFLKEWLPIFRNKKERDDIYLLRGTDSISDDFGEKKVRTDRVPSATKRQISQDVDDAMYKRFKIHGRKASIFCTGNEDTAESYGKSFIVFPVGAYKYLWSPVVEDLFVYLNNDPSGYLYDVSKEIEMEMNRKGFYQNLEWKEVLVHKEKLRKEIEESNKKALLKMVSSYKTTDLKKAISTGNEIMVQCSSYIYVHYSREEELRNIIRNSL